jgi:hypothetical protein
MTNETLETVTMRGSDFQNLPITFWIGWPLSILAAIGLGAIICAICYGLFWIASHLQWVP